MDFEAELKKFQPSLEVEQVEDAIYNNSTDDVVDLLQKIVEENAGNSGRRKKEEE